MPRCVSPIARTARSCSLLLLVLGLSACTNRISASYEAKTMDRVIAINEKVLTQFDRLLSTSLVCRPRPAANESFKSTYGDIEVLLRVHRMAEEIRPANAESAKMATLYLQSWQLHRLSHQLWVQPRSEAEQKLKSLRAQLKNSADLSADQATSKEGIQLLQQIAILTENNKPDPSDEAVEANQVKYAFMACEAISGGAKSPIQGHSRHPRNWSI